jgi:hypothetical protein
MTIIEGGRTAADLRHGTAGPGRADHHRGRTELVIAVVLAAWAIVLLCGCIAGAMP